MDHDTTALDGQLAESCYSHILCTEDLAKAESDTLDDLLERLRTALGLAITRFNEKVFAEREPGWKVKDRRSRRIFTEFGEVEYARRIYIDDCGERSTLADELLDIPNARYLSPNAFSLVTRFAADLLCRHAYSSLSATAVTGSMRALGSILYERDRAASHDLFAKGLALDAELEREEICAEADGIWVPQQHDSRDMAEVKAFCACSGKAGGAR